MWTGFCFPISKEDCHFISVAITLDVLSMYRCSSKQIPNSNGYILLLPLKKGKKKIDGINLNSVISYFIFST